MSTTTYGWVNGSQCAQNSTHITHTETKEINNQIMNYSTHIVVVLTQLAALHNIYNIHATTFNENITSHTQCGQTCLTFELHEMPHLIKLFLCNFFMTFAIIWKGSLVRLSPCVCARNNCRKKFAYEIYGLLFILLISCSKWHQKLTQTFYHKTSLHTFHFFQFRRRRFFHFSN